MSDAELRRRHAEAREHHEARQAVEGMRYAVRVLRADLPSGKTQRSIVLRLIGRLQREIVEVESRLP